MRITENIIRASFFALVILVAATLPLFPAPCAHGAEAIGKTAPELTGMAVMLSDGQNAAALTDADDTTVLSLSGASSVTVSCPDGIYGLYIVWNKIPGVWSYTADGKPFTAGADGFLHEYIALSAAARSVTISVPDAGAQIADIYGFGTGPLPDWVQVWAPPCGRADLMLFSTHADDEHLFYAGVLPYYAGEIGAAVQVVYMTNHWDTASRSHEQLNGLWAVGMRRYPIVGPFADDAASLGSTAESAETVLTRALGVYDEVSLTAFQVEMLRRFRPQVVVGHDIAGEYRHGAHIVNTHTLLKALDLSGDASYDPASAERWGVWEVKKTYLHLYPENPVEMNWDTPLSHFGGLTAFEVSKLGYACHLSQQWTWFTRWISPASAAGIAAYSPCKYGLYRTTVGPDIHKNDFLENIVTYRELDARIAAERAAEASRIIEEKRAAEAERAAEAASAVQEQALPSGDDTQPESTPTAGVPGSAAAIATTAAFACAGIVFALVVPRRKKRGGGSGS